MAKLVELMEALRLNEGAYIVEFWSNEKVYEPPASRTRNVTWTGDLYKVELHAELGKDCGAQWYLTRITLNGETVWAGRRPSVDLEIRPEIVNKGPNTMILDYEVGGWAPWICVHFGCPCTAYLRLYTTGRVTVAPVRAPTPWWQYAIYGGLAVGGIYATAKLIRALRGR